MFDIGFSELVVVGVVALIVIGPERLPKVARTAGHLLGRFQRYAASVKSDISREMQMDELRKVGEDFKESIESAASDIESQVNVVDDYLKDELGYSDKALVAQAEPETEIEWGEPEIPQSESADPTLIPHPQQSLDLRAAALRMSDTAGLPASPTHPARSYRENRYQPLSSLLADR